MPVTVEWANEEHTLVHMKLIGRWTWTEVYTKSDEGWDMLETVNHKVGVIMDFRESLGVPTAGITHARSMIGRRHPNTGLTVFVGANSLVLRMWRIFVQLNARLRAEQEFVFADTIDEAREILLRHLIEQR